MMNRPTPPPWRVIDGTGFAHEIMAEGYESTDVLVATVNHLPDARLMAQAHDMLSALKELLMAYENGWLNYSWPANSIGKVVARQALERARDAVRAAEGRNAVYLINGDLTGML